jgi:hypothetical protein
MAPKNNVKNVAAFRARRRQQNVVRVEVYAHAEDAKLIKELAKQLKEKRDACNVQ